MAGDTYVIAYTDGTLGAPACRTLSDYWLLMAWSASAPRTPAYRIRVRRTAETIQRETYTRRNAEDIHD